MLVGRDIETARLGELLAHARHGSSASLVVHGDPGVGKSALLEELVAGAGELLVLRTQGFEAEAPLAFAALHRLLLPVMRLREDLPAPQARALRVAFGEEDGPSIEPFLVAVATLSLLTAAAEEHTVLAVVEDAHWLDSATADALLFCARRLGADRVLMVFSARDGTATPFRPDGIAELALAGLDLAAARQLLDERLGNTSAPEVIERLIAESAGNPLALLELPTELSPEQLKGTSPLPGQLHLTTRVEQAFLGRSRLLPAGVQSVLLLAAADDTGNLAVLRQASSDLGLPEQALEDAAASGLVVLEESSVRVRHPLVRSALYQGATAQRRRTVHRALAGAVEGLGDPDRAAWHRAAAAEGPDPVVVAALELVGARAERRGAYVSALAAYERAAELSTLPAERAVLLLAAARNAWGCGRSSQARSLLAATRQFAHDPVLLSDIARLQGRIEVNIGSADAAHRLFNEAAHMVHALDPARALEMAVSAAIMTTFGADGGARLDPGDVDTVVTEADSPRTACLKQMYVAMTRAGQGQWAAAVSVLDGALKTGEDVTDLDVLANLGNAALQLGDDQAQQRFYTRAMSRAREVGGAMTVVYALQRLCFGYLVAGDWVAVRSSAEEALALATSLGQRPLAAPPLAWLTLLAALQGRDDYEILLGDLEEVLATHPLGILTDPVHDLTRWAKGAHAAAAADPLGALHHLSQLRVPAVARMAATERIDVAVRAGDPGLARRWIGELAEFADATGRPWALATVAYGQAMTSDTDNTTGTGGPAGEHGSDPHSHPGSDPGSDRGRLFEDALAHHAHAHRSYDLARTQLAYGQWLRRSQRRVDAREHLRRALETFNTTCTPSPS